MTLHPPEFAPYDASYTVSSTGSVVSHDPHLNEDGPVSMVVSLTVADIPKGEALYRFLLSQATIPPGMFLHCRGSHQETHTRFVNNEDGGDSETRTEQYTKTIVDFDFKIDISQHIIRDPTHWSVADSTPAYRGRVSREIGLGYGKRKATSAECKAAEAWDKERDSRGLPPWISGNYAHGQDQQPHVSHANGVLESSWTVRQWADDYCASQKILKEFEYHKVVYGWNFDAIIAATRFVISSTHYKGDAKVSFETFDSVVAVRSHNRLSRALSNGWIKFLLIITLIYPFLWLFRRFHHRGGGIWRVCGGAYALKRVEQVTSPPEYPGDSKKSDNLPPDVVHATTSRLLAPADPPITVAGLREGVWFREWEDTIRRAVLQRIRVSDPLVLANSASPLVALDGY